MKRLVGFLAGLMLCVAAGNAQASTIGFSAASAGLGTIDFAGGDTGNFGFSGNFAVTGPLVGLSNTLLGAAGSIGGNYTFGAISSGFGVESASVTSSNGTFSLFDAIGGGTLSATVAWIDIFTFGSTGGLNAGGTVNLTNFTYTGGSGPSANFVALLGSTNPVTALSFQFVNPTRSLSSLKATGGSTSYSLSYSANYNPPPPVPEPASMVLLGTGLLGVAALARRRAKGQSAN